MAKTAFFVPDPRPNAKAKTSIVVELPDLDEDGVPIEQDRPRKSLWPPPLDLAAMLTTDPEPPAMIIDDWLPAGYATLLAGHGGIGKSNITLQIAICIAAGIPFCGMPVKRRKVLYLSCEDRAGVIHWRLTRAARYLGVSEIPGLDIRDLVGHPAVLWGRNHVTGGVETVAFDVLKNEVSDHGIEVIFVDGVSDTFGGNENDRSDVKRFVNMLVGIIPPDRGAVFLVHHVNKLAANGAATSEGYSGSTGWHNAVRARWYLYPETERGDEGIEDTGRLALCLQKSNLGQSGHSIMFRWDSQAHLFIGEQVASMSEFDRRAEAREELDGIVAAIAEIEADGDHVPAAAQGPRTAHSVLCATKSLPDSLRSVSARKRFWRHIESLRRKGIVREGSKRRANRHAVATLTLEASPDKRASNASNSGEVNMTHSGADAFASNAPHSGGGYRGARARNRHGGDGGDGGPIRV